MTNYLKIKYYNFKNRDKSIYRFGTYYLHSITRYYNSTPIIFTFQNKGLSCLNLKDYDNNYDFFITCFIISSYNNNNYLIPIIFKEDSDRLLLSNNYYSLDKIKANDNKLIISETDFDMNCAFIYLVTEQNIGSSFEFYLESYYHEGIFYTGETLLDKNCKSDIYGIKMNYLFENNKILFSCINLDGNLQVKIFGNEQIYYKFENCSSIYSYSIIYSNNYPNYFVISDVNCPEGKIPYDSLIESSDFIPEIIAIDTTNKYQTEDVTNIYSITNSEKIMESTFLEKTIGESTNKITDKIVETIFYSNNITETISESEKITIRVDDETTKTIELINNTSEIIEGEETEINSLINEILENHTFCTKYKDKNTFLQGFMSCISKNTEINNNKIKNDILQYNKNFSKSQSYINVCEKSGNYYYQKFNDLNINYSYIKCCCIPEGNYLYSNYSIPLMESCYSSCKICEKGGNIKYHNCIECKENYNLGLNISNYLNCYLDNEIKNYSKEDIENIKKILLNNYLQLEKLSGKNIEFEVENILISLTSTNNQKNNLNKNKTTIDFGDCEKKLKQKYNIEFNRSLYILKFDVKEEGLKIPKIEYEIYYPLNGHDLIKLNLTVCKDNKIDIFIPVSINDDLDKYNPSSKYYNDICSKAISDVGTDITLKDRRKEFVNKNMTLCEENCNLIDYNYDTEIAKCSCNVKISLPFIEDIVFDKNKLYQSFIDVKNIANINLMKYYKKVLNIESLKKNYGFFLFLIIFVIYFITLILFISKYYSSLKKEIMQIVGAKIYLSKLKSEKSRKNVNNINSQNKIKRNNQNNKKIKKIKLNKNKRKGNSNKNIFTNETKIKNINKRTIKQLQPKKINCNPVKKKNMITSEINKINSSTTAKNKNYIKYKTILEYNDYELNSLIYEKALIYDKRTFSEYYISLLRIKHLLIFSFYCNNRDHNSQIIKFFLFFFFFSVHITINAMFFGDKTLHKILIDKGEYNFIYQIPQIIYSSLISSIINIFIRYLSLSEKDIIEIKREKKINSLKGKEEALFTLLKRKFTLFFICTFLLLLFFMYYITCFCGVYEHTQLYLIEDSLISFGLSLIYPFGLCLIPGIFRIPSLRDEKKNKQCLYRTSLLIQVI